MGSQERKTPGLCVGTTPARSEDDYRLSTSILSGSGGAVHDNIERSQGGQQVGQGCVATA